MNPTLKRYLRSSITTFAAGFLLVFIPEIQNIDLSTIQTGAFVGVLFAGLRAGIKATLEYFLDELE